MFSCSESQRNHLIRSCALLPQYVALYMYIIPHREGVLQGFGITPPWNLGSHKSQFTKGRSESKQQRPRCPDFVVQCTPGFEKTLDPIFPIMQFSRVFHQIHIASKTKLKFQPWQHHPGYFFKLWKAPFKATDDTKQMLLEADKYFLWPLNWDDCVKVVESPLKEGSKTFSHRWQAQALLSLHLRAETWQSS